MEDGSALGTGFAYPITIDILKAWTARLDEKGIALAPVSAATRTIKSETPVIDTAGIDTAQGGQTGG